MAVFPDEPRVTLIHLIHNRTSEIGGMALLLLSNYQCQSTEKNTKH